MLLTISYSDRLTRLTYENLWKHISVYYLFDYSLIVTTTKSENMLLTISYSDRLNRLSYENLCQHISMYILFSRKQQQKVKICCWQYHIRNVLPDKLMKIIKNTFKCKLINWILFNRKLQQKVTTCCWQYHIRNVVHDKPMTI